MVIDCIADLHGFYPFLSGGDLLIIAGDLTASDTVQEYEQFNHWLSHQKYRCKIVIAGNHDGECEKRIGKEPIISARNTVYLMDSFHIFQGVKIYGSPWIPMFGDWYFMKTRGYNIRKEWMKIPQDTDILVTHTPPYSILDRDYIDNSYGCSDLGKRVYEILPRLHIFGHIHEAYGKLKFDWDGFKKTEFINCSHINGFWEPINKPVRINM